MFNESMFTGIAGNPLLLIAFVAIAVFGIVSMRYIDNLFMARLNEAKAHFFKYDDVRRLIESPIGTPYSEIFEKWGAPAKTKSTGNTNVYTWKYGWAKCELEFDSINKLCVGIRDDGSVYGHQTKFSKT